MTRTNVDGRCKTDKGGHEVKKAAEKLTEIESLQHIYLLKVKQLKRKNVGIKN